MRGFLTETLETILLALVIFLLLQTSVQNFRVEGASMEPTLTSGDFLLVNKVSYLGFAVGEVKRLLPLVSGEDGQVVYPFQQPEQGQVVVFRFPENRNRFFVKRIIGVPGDTVELRNGQVILNGAQLEEPYVKGRGSRTMGPLHVPAESYFVLGDNRNASNDSRHWDFIYVPRADIIGTSWLTYQPPSPLTFLSPSSNVR